MSAPRPWWETIAEVPESEQMNFMKGSFGLSQYGNRSVLESLVAGYLGSKMVTRNKKPQ